MLMVSWLLYIIGSVASWVEGWRLQYGYLKRKRYCAFSNLDSYWLFFIYFSAYMFFFPGLTSCCFQNILFSSIMKKTLVLMHFHYLLSTRYWRKKKGINMAQHPRTIKQNRIPLLNTILLLLWWTAIKTQRKTSGLL